MTFDEAIAELKRGEVLRHVSAPDAVFLMHSDDCVLFANYTKDNSLAGLRRVAMYYKLETLQATGIFSDGWEIVY